MRLKSSLIVFLFFFFFVSCQLFQTKVSGSEEQKEEIQKYYLFSLPRRLSLETAPEGKEDFLKKEIIAAKDRWNKWFHKDVFYFRGKNIPKITIRDGSKTIYCLSESKLLAFAVPINDGATILRGSIYVCLDSFKFAKRTGFKNLDLSFVITHEIGHFIFKQHFALSNLMNESFKDSSLSEFDKKVLIPSLQKINFITTKEVFQ